MKKYVPPARGMAVASSAVERSDGRRRTPERRYASTTAGPIFAAAIPGSTNKPELIIAPEDIANTFINPSCFESFFAIILYPQRIFI
jgi:hypothetical protein